MWRSPSDPARSTGDALAQGIRSSTSRVIAYAGSGDPPRPQGHLLEAIVVAARTAIDPERENRGIFCGSLQQEHACVLRAWRPRLAW
jgi:hypothetical protein